MRRWRVIKPLFPTIHTAIVDSLENRLLHKISDHEMVETGQRSGSEGGVLPWFGVISRLLYVDVLGGT
ncbi:unnamed protein product [Linum trigynum]|uniref:Uncharacterized protein n=1 Tax=Linum trigynum TaxID=586398 RepID=A0AAV2EPN1_9ROSI